MKEQTNQTSDSFERSGILQRIKDLGLLALYTVISAFIALIFMDLIIYPVSSFALNRTGLFTFLFRYGILFFAAGSIIFFIAKKVKKYRKHGAGAAEIILALLKIPARTAAVFIFILLVSGVIIAALWFMLSINSSLISSFAG